MKTYILSWLLFNANKSKDKRFYPIKNKILNKYGKKIDTEVQFIEGKKCSTCRGHGIHYSGIHYSDICWNCAGTGWFKDPVWNWLEVVKFGKYTFHQPFLKSYNKPTEIVKVFDGYIDHQNTRYTDFSLFLVFLVYEKGYLKRWYNEIGIGWKVCWWLPRNWIRNIIHILKHGRNSIPFRKRPKQQTNYNYTPDNLPF